MPARPKPYQQGDLDGLCGLYAVINAVRLICPQLSDEECGQLFRDLVLEADEFASRVAFAIEGLSLDDVLMLIGKIQERLLQRQAIRIEVITLELDGRPSLDRVWQGLRRELRSGSAVILSLKGYGEGHWTVACGAGPRRLHLFDSARMTRLERLECSLRTSRERIRLSPDKTLVLRRARESVGEW